MDLGQLYVYLMQQRELEEQKRREALAKMLNSRASRRQEGPNAGTPYTQGDGGVYTDSLPFTIEDYMATHKPGLDRFFYNQKPVPATKETNLKPKNPYQGLVL